MSAGEPARSEEVERCGGGRIAQQRAAAIRCRRERSRMGTRTDETGESGARGAAPRQRKVHRRRRPRARRCHRRCAQPAVPDPGRAQGARWPAEGGARRRHDDATHGKLAEAGRKPRGHRRASGKKPCRGRSGTSRCGKSTTWSEMGSPNWRSAQPVGRRVEIRCFKGRGTGLQPPRRQRRPRRPLGGWAPRLQGLQARGRLRPKPKGKQDGKG